MERLLLVVKVLHLLPSPDSDTFLSCHEGQRQSSLSTITTTCNYCHLARCLGLGDALINAAEVGDVRASHSWLWSMGNACQACQDPVRFSVQELGNYSLVEWPALKLIRTDDDKQQLLKWSHLWRKGGSVRKTVCEMNKDGWKLNKNY